MKEVVVSDDCGPARDGPFVCRRAARSGVGVSEA